MESWKLTWTKLTQLDQSNVQNIPDSTPGVYRLSYLSEDGNRYVFYVGQADDLRGRILQHIQDSEENTCIKTYFVSKPCFFRYAKATSPDVRDAAEKQMYKRYKPRCNERDPGGREDIEVNLT